MKNLLLCGSLLLAGIGSLQAQVTKTPMIEHFTQASCGPCAGQNPALKTTLDNFGTANYVKISHQVSWPGFDPMYNEFSAGPDARVGYYNVSGVPNTCLNGGAPGGPNTVVTASTLSAAAALMTPYQITATQSWSDPNTVTVNIDVDNVTGTAISSADKIYVTMIENEVAYSSSPGSNGETEFYNVMRQMYDATSGSDNATGGAALAAIPANGTQNFNFTISSLPSYIADKGQVIFAIYVQNDATKEVLQAGKTAVVSIPGLINVEANTASVAGSGYCDYSYTPGIEFTNNDPAAVTEVVVEYTINGGAAVSETYTGSLAQGQSSTIAFPATTLAGGTSVVSYNVVSVNGAQNWQSPAAVSVPDETYSKLALTAVAAPVSEGMESAPLTGGISQDLTTAIFDSPTVGAGSFAVVDGPANNIGVIGGYAASDRSILFQFYALQSGVMNLVMEKVNLGANSELSFDHAYRQYQAENDELDISVSTDCGATWASVFNESGSSLMTLPAAQPQFFPSAASDWATTNIDMSAYDNMQDVIVRFKATSAYGNNLFIDNINLGTAAVGVEDITASTFDVYPNPATDVVTVELSEVGSVDAQIEVLDIKGQVVSSEVMSAGQTSVQVNTSSLASGIYTVRVKSENGVATERVVIK
jgi:hypothetical protein